MQEPPISLRISARRTGRKQKVTIKVLADLADGSQMRFTGDHYLSKYKSLAVQGYEGKALGSSIRRAPYSARLWDRDHSLQPGYGLQPIH
jgi:hypothetical protein